MDISIDKPQIFENQEATTVDMDNVTFEVDAQGNLLIHSSTKDLAGYFPKDKWDCVYRRDDTE